MTAETAAGTAPEVAMGGTPDFPVTFADPTDAGHTWERDDMHMPFALTPLGADFIVHAIARAFTPYYERSGRPSACSRRPGTAGLTSRSGPTCPRPRRSVRGTLGRDLRGRIPLTHAYWNDEVLPTHGDLRLDRERPDRRPRATRRRLSWTDAWARPLGRGCLGAHFLSDHGPVPGPGGPFRCLRDGDGPRPRRRIAGADPRRSTRARGGGRGHRGAHRPGCRAGAHRAAERGFGERRAHRRARPRRAPHGSGRELLRRRARAISRAARASRPEPR